MEESLLYRKPKAATCGIVIFVILYILVLVDSLDCGGAASYTSKVGSSKLEVDILDNKLDNIGCIPFSHTYLINHSSEKHRSLLGIDFHGSLDNECFHNSEGLVLGFSDLNLHRNLVGEGSHRRVISNMIFNVQPSVVSLLDAHFCEVVVIERLPIGVFADPFELQHLVRRRVFLDAAVFGDTNLELPSALSNHSIVEIHMDLRNGNLSKCLEITTELPLHARYPPLGESGYSTVEIGRPDLFVRCRPRSKASSWVLTALNVESANGVTWLVPCGSEAHAGFVSTITFLSALIFALSIVFSAMYCSTDYNVDSKSS